jgi:hypothetical protein
MPTHPDCQSDPSQCRIRELGMMVATEIEWTPIYDGHGAMTNVDPNTYVTERACDMCGANWFEARTGSDVVVTSKVTPGQATPAEQNDG